MIIIGGTEFDDSLFDSLMLQFKDSFSRASLTVEKAFNEYEEAKTEYKSLLDKSSYNTYLLCDKETRTDIDNYLKRFVVYYGHYTSVINGPFDPNCSQKIVDKEFNNNFKCMYDDLHYLIEFDDDINFIQRDTFRKVGEFFKLFYLKKNSKDRAYNMQKDHLDAFDYAIGLSDIDKNQSTKNIIDNSIKRIIDINTMVTRSDPDQEIGFKKTNNALLAADFEVTDKSLVPFEMQELINDYENNFGLEILDPNEPNIGDDERYRRIREVFKKEAIFHIRFIRIHPFADGNGRTGRIIMNKHLLENQMAPVMFTGITREDYIDCINKNDSDGLARMMLLSSSQLLEAWRTAKNIKSSKNKENSTLAKYVVDDESSKTKRLTLFKHNPLLLL